MTQEGERSLKLRRLAREIGPTLLITASVWLGWQVVRETVAERLPPRMALRISPASAQVLSRAAEMEFAAKRYDSAEALARKALAAAPFNATPLRVLGLTTAEKGDMATADAMLTLAGNWSLRDDPSHAWLMRHRLFRGDFSSAFAHADTLARRRLDLRPDLFNFFKLAATTDRRAIPALAKILVGRPPWRREFLDELNKTDDGLALSANLAASLANTASPYSQSELSSLNSFLLRSGRLAAMSEVRRRTAGSDVPGLFNGDFDPISAPAPHDWMLHGTAGLIAEVVADDLRGDPALRIQHSSFDAQPIAQQLIHLGPGRYRFSGERRIESGDASGRLSWRVVCFEDNRILTPSVPMTGAGWQPFAVDFSIPATGCTAQWVRLSPLPSDQRKTVIAWFDRLAVRKTN